ncbi:rCG56592, isoform CRA_b [Rattus norvegicus]|uniref:RCG56592, isoform CRA_b n=1 Tax=Rattus norvegicus TaxID=10116 RepID=A6KEN5_RAT|nr:rCG56592, isoform CRA_b [Rattus norvegicus]
MRGFSYSNGLKRSYCQNETSFQEKKDHCSYLTSENYICDAGKATRNVGGTIPAAEFQD